MTIRKRLTLWYAGLLTLIIVLLGGTVYALMRWSMVASIDNTLEETSNQINLYSRLVVIPDIGKPPHVWIELPVLDFFRASGVEVQVWKLENNEYVLEDSSANLVDYQQPLDQKALGSTTDKVYTHVIIDNTQWRIRTSPIFDPQGNLVGNIQVAESMGMVNKAAYELLIVVLICCALAIFGSSLLSMWLAGRMLRPIEDISRAAAQVVGTKDLSTRLVWQGPMDELGRLNEVFNQMMARLEHIFTVQQRFIADISHELRTPLTTICGNLDLVKRYGMDDISLEAITDETERMKRLVNDLLMLARADYGGVQIELAPLELDSVMMDIFRQMRGLGKDRNLQLKMPHIEPLQVNGNSDRLKQVLLNLVDNAFKFTPDGGIITLKLHRVGLDAVIEVTDTGAGIPAEDLERIFDRFYQSDPSRHQNSTGGFGLGLSIAKWIVDAHGGSIHADSEIGKGTTFSIKLPLYDPNKTNSNISNVAVTRPRLPVLRRVPPRTTINEEHHLQ